MYCKGVFAFCLLAIVLGNTSAFPIGYPSSLNAISNYNAQLQEAMPGTPVITEIVPTLQFGDISVTGDLPVGGSIRVRGVFPVYGSVAVDGGLPSIGTAVVNTGSVVAQII